MNVTSMRKPRARLHVTIGQAYNERQPLKVCVLCLYFMGLHLSNRQLPALQS